MQSNAKKRKGHSLALDLSWDLHIPLFEGNGVPEKNASLFTELMLSRSIYSYKRYRNISEPILFDRGIPDMIGYASLFNLELDFAKCAAEAFQYNKSVFITADWEQIYTTDDERKMTYEQAKAFGTSIRSIYQDLGYQLIEVPKMDISQRADFILEYINRALQRTNQLKRTTQFLE